MRISYTEMKIEVGCRANTLCAPSHLVANARQESALYTHGQELDDARRFKKPAVTIKTIDMVQWPSTCPPKVEKMYAKHQRVIAPGGGPRFGGGGE